MKKAQGRFDVKVSPLPATEGVPHEIGRMLLEKQFEGALEASSRGQMLTAMGTVGGSAAYVAIEVITGTLDGRRGTFAMQHRGVMQGESRDMLVSVVPDSGTAELAGLSGRMVIDIAGDGEHTYTFEYVLGDPR